MHQPPQDDMFARAKKRRRKRFFLNTSIALVVIFLSLTLAGRSISSHPLPWHLSFLAPLGDTAWTAGFKLTVKDGMSKKEVIEAFGNPHTIYSESKNHTLDQKNEDLIFEERESESWNYISPHTKTAGPSIFFSNGKVVKQ